MSLELNAALASAAFILAIVALERRFPYRRQPFLRQGFATDLVFYTAAQGYLVALAIRGLEGLGLPQSRLLEGWPVWAQLLLFLVTHDLYIYCFHRWQHSSPLLWRLHEAHHSVRDLDWVASSRSHLVEMLINGAVEFAPMLLLGAAPEVAVLKGAISACWGVWIHSNVDVRSGRLQWLINGPEAHRWHHAVDADARGKNFATKLALWDRLFGTAFLPKGKRPSGYGLRESYPEDYLGQQLHAFRARPARRLDQAPA